MKSIIRWPLDPSENIFKTACSQPGPSVSIKAKINFMPEWSIRSMVCKVRNPILLGYAGFYIVYF
jgi:hypothetical protein